MQPSRLCRTFYVLKTTFGTQPDRCQGLFRRSASAQAVPQQENKSNLPVKQSALFAPTGDVEGGNSVIFAVQPYVDLQWLLHDSDDEFASNLRRRGYDPSNYPSRASLLHDAKLLSKLHMERAEIKQRQKNIANEMAKLKQSLTDQPNANQPYSEPADESTRKYAQTLRQEGLRLRSLAKNQNASIFTLEQRVILPALSLPNRLVPDCFDNFSDSVGVSDKLSSICENIEMRSTSPSPYMRGLPAEAELWLLNTIMNEFINRHSFIPLSPPSLYQAVAAEGCTATDPVNADDRSSEKTGSNEHCHSPSYAVLFPPSMEQGSSKAHETRATYLLCHPCMPTAAFLANAEIPTVSLPAKLVWSARMHLATPLSRQYKHFLFSQPNVVGWTALLSSSINAGNHANTLNVIMDTTWKLVQQALEKVSGEAAGTDSLNWTIAPPSELFNDEMVRLCLMFGTEQQGSGRLELARCSLGGTFISKRLKILHALDKNDYKKTDAGHVKRNFPGDYGFLECIHGLINLSHVASLCTRAR